MSVQHIIAMLKDLTDVHKEMLQLSKEKTEAIKAGTVEKLQSLLVKERKQIRLLEQAEVKRQEAVEDWFQQQQLPNEDATVTNMLTYIKDRNDQEALAKEATELTEMITKLKHQEQLNKTLVEQSMEFVQLSLELLNPSITNMNYGKEKKETKINRSLFDSQA